MENTITFTFSQQLSAKLDRVFPFMADEVRQIWDETNARELYPVYLKHMHFMVRSAVPLMDAALSVLAALPSEDPLADPLINYLLKHREEERGHDRWLLQDLEAIGGDPEEVTEAIPPSEAAQLVGVQYYWLRHAHPVSLLGHMAAIEGYHPPKGLAQTLSDRTGYPLAGFRAIKRHETLDIHHKAELHDLLDNLPLTERHRKIITISGLHTMRAGMEMMRLVLSHKKQCSASNHVQTEARASL